jgi:hypothetical protein
MMHLHRREIFLVTREPQKPQIFDRAAHQA